MLKIAERLLLVSYLLFALAFVAFLIVASVGVVGAVEGIPARWTVWAMSASLVTAMFSVPMFAAGVILKELALGRAGHDRMRDEWRSGGRKRSTTIPLKPMDKPDGYNRDVTWWFFNGPERRIIDSEFEAGFNARAMVPPPKARR